MTRDEAIDAYFSVFAMDGFAAATIGLVAEQAGVTAAALVEAVGDRWAAIDAFARRLDHAGLAAADPAGSVRDRLFDMTMARFDAAQLRKEVLRGLGVEARRRPALGLAALATLTRTAALYLSAAGVNTIGLAGLARVKGFSAILGDVGRQWLQDDDADQGATMRALDRRLDQAERLMDRLCRRPGDVAMPEASGAV